MKALIPIGTFALRQGLALAAAVLAGWILWTLIYLLLIALAVLLNEPLGGPASWPMGMILVVVVGMVLGLGIFVPACGIGRLLGAILRLPRFAEIPIVFLGDLVLSCTLYGLHIRHLTTHSMPKMGTVIWNYGIFIAGPLGAWWWLTEGPWAILEGVRGLLDRRRKATATTTPQSAPH